MKTRRQFLKASATAAAACALPLIALSAEPNRVRIGSVLAGTTVAGELLPKYLSAAGIKAEIVNFPNITQRMQAVASGDVQIGYGGISAAITMAGRGFPLVVLSNACDGGFAMVARKGISSYADLKGKKVAVQLGSMQFALLQWKLKQIGLINDVELLNLNNPDMVVALQRGDVDAALAIEPYPTMIIANDWGQALGTVYDTPAGRTNLGFIAAHEFIIRNPELTATILRAHADATRQLASDPTLAVDTMVKTLNVSHEVAQASMKNTFFSIESGEAFRKAVAATGDLMMQSGVADKLPDWNTFFHNA